MFNVNEIKSWAKKRGITVKKQGDGYVWFPDGGQPGEPDGIGEVAKQIFNKITDGRFAEHQKNYRP